MSDSEAELLIKESENEHITDKEAALLIGRQRKEMGNVLFRGQIYCKAREHYELAIDIVKKSFGKKCSVQSASLLSKCHYNLAAVDIEEHDWKQAIANCNAALAYDNEYEKAKKRKEFALKQLHK